MRAVLCLCVALVLSACSDKVEEADVELVGATTVLEFKVDGMSCGGCEQAINSVVAKIDGVVSCEASHEKGLTVVTVKEGTAGSEIEDAISKLGFEVSAPQG